MYNVVVVQAEMQDEEIGTGLEDNKNKTQQEEIVSSAAGFEQNGLRDFATAATTNGFSSRETSAVLQEEKAAAEAEVLVTSETGTSGRTRKPRTPRPNAGRTSTRRKKSSKTATQEGATDTETDGFYSGFSPSEIGTDVEFSDGGEVRDSRSGSEAEVVSGDGYGMSSSSSSRPSAAAGRRVLLQHKDKSNGNVRIRVDGKRDSRFSRGGGGEEKELRFMFLEAIMERAWNSDVAGAEEAMSEMQIAGLQAGPRAYHGLIVTYTRAGDTEGGLQALRREVGVGVKPLPETMVALARLFGAKGQLQRGEEVLAAMEKLNHDPRVAWLVLVEELFRAGYRSEANSIFLRGANGGLRGTNELYDMLVDENCKVGDHENAIDILRVMEYAGRMSTTFHYNCLLRAQAHAGAPDIAAMTFETMQYGREEMKPDTESYNWLLQAHTRHKFGDRLQEVVDLLGEMIEDHKRVQPNMKTYALLIECFTKYGLVNEAVRHFRALVRIPGSMCYLFSEGHGRESDPLSLYLRALCLEGRASQLLETLEAMVRDNQPIPKRAMLINRKGRTLVSSWIEPLQQEADLGYEVDYAVRFIAEGGISGTRRRWSASADGSRALNPDDDGFAYAVPVEVSYKGFLTQMRRRYNLRLIRKLRMEGASALGHGATDADVKRVVDRLVRETIGDSNFQVKKPKAASKMLVIELKEELEAQGLPTEGTRPVLYQRVQKARRINRARGRPLWVPPSEEEIEETNDDDLDVFMERLNLKNENSEFWRKRFTGEDLTEGDITESDIIKASLDTDEDAFTDDEEEEDEDEDVEAGEEADYLVEDGGEIEETEPPGMLAMQLLKNKKDFPEKVEMKDPERREGQWLGLSLEEKIEMLKSEKRFDVAELYTIADVWGWTWERELRELEPEEWSQEKEVQLGIEIMFKVQELGEVPTIGDCGTLVRAAMRTPWPEAIISLLQHSHKLGYVFGSKLYSDAVSLCLRLGEKDAAINIITEMEDVGVPAPEDILTDVLRESQEEGS